MEVDAVRVLDAYQLPLVGFEVEVPGGLKVKWRELGWRALIEEFAPDSIGAELVEMEAV